MSSEVSCTHCNLPVPTGLVDPENPDQFCCAGCRLAYEIINDHGLERYYTLKNRVGAEATPAHSVDKSFQEFDDPAFDELYCRNIKGGLKTVDLYLEGVHCAACVWLVERTAVIVEGAAEVRLDMGRSLATVTWNPEIVSLSEIARFINSLGYAPHPFQGVEALQMARKEERALLLRIAVSGAIAGNVMLLAFSLYGGYLHGIAETYENLFRWMSLVLSLPSILWAAGVFYRGAWGALKARTLHMDVPITVGILSGGLWGALNTIRGTGEIYFDSVTVLIFFLLAGRFIQRRQQRSAARATELLFSLAPSSARLIEDTTIREVPLAALVPGNLVEVRAGESIPADGIVRSGASELDLSLLTGETRPVEVTTGRNVHAGTTNISAVLHIEVITTGQETRLGRLLRLVEEGSRRRAPVMLMADRISSYFVAAVLLLALLTVTIWLFVDPSRAIENAIALLIVSCPCALGLATPLAVGAAIGRAARIGILVKGGDALEALAHPAHMILDKTGTLTEGRFALVRYEGDDAYRPLIAAMESCSSHPIARALNSDFDANHQFTITNLKEHRGYGITADVDGQKAVLGAPSYVAQNDDEALTEINKHIANLIDETLTPIVLTLDGNIKAVLGLGDPLRPDARTALREIIKRGWTVEVLSGDHSAVVCAIAEKLGLDPRDTHGESDPEAKVKRTREALLNGTTVMVGDGVNDAAALAEATVGIGVHGGAEAALAAADIYLGTPGLTSLATLLDGATRTLQVIRRNLIFSILYNLIAVSLAMMGMMHPLLAAILMPLSSITVVFSSYRAKTFVG